VKNNARELFAKNQTTDAVGLEGWMCNKDIVKGRAFYDDQYYTYLKTNMKYLEEFGAHKNRQRPVSSTNNNLINSFHDQIKN
jgi:hypothetical protein